MKKTIYILLVFISLFSLFTQDTTGDTKKEEKIEATTSSTSSITTEIKKTEVTSTENKKKNGWEYFVEGKYLDSINALLEEKKYYPERINIYVILGWDYRELKRYEEMEKISLEGLAIKNDDKRVIKNLAEALFFQEKYQDAIVYLQKYIALSYKTEDIHIPSIYYYLGVSFLNLNNYNKADIALSTAKFYQPKNINILLALGQVKEKLKDYDNALKFYKEVISLSPNNNKALEAIKRIEDINKNKKE